MALVPLAILGTFLWKKVDTEFTQIGNIANQNGVAIISEMSSSLAKMAGELKTMMERFKV